MISSDRCRPTASRRRTWMGGGVDRVMPAGAARPVSGGYLTSDYVPVVIARMDLNNELSAVTDELAASELELLRWQAKVEGLRAHRDALARAMRDRGTPRSPGSADLR